MPKGLPFFQKYVSEFDVQAPPINGRALRACQLGAYWAAWAHFSASDEPALLSLPTGAGKTGVMTALAFGLQAKRVLVITPGRLLRDQLAQEFQSLALLRESGILKASVPPPKVVSNEQKLRTKDLWSALAEFDVVTATPTTVSPAQGGVCSPPDELFDLVFVDEAHHAPARTWTAILRAFRSVRCILLTATPFRADNRRLGARLVYYYPIAKALSDGIYRPVEYHPVVAPPNRAYRDGALCAAAKDVFDGEKARGNAPRIVARADNVGWSNRLVDTYEEHGLRMGAVDYEKSAADNDDVIRRVRDGKLDGMVCVGMVGEGIDLPALKIAVLHAAPRTLPFTLQFVGRVSRTTAGEPGDAHLLSIPEEMTGDMQRLHREDADWRLLIPKLAEEVLGASSDYRQFRSGFSLEEHEVNPSRLRPFFSVRVYRGTSHTVTLPSARLDAPDGAELCLDDRKSLADGIVVISGREVPPPWAIETPILDTLYDLHVYLIREGLLFEATSWEGGADQLRAQLFGSSIRTLNASEVMRAMHGNSGAAATPTYYNIGLRNATASSRAQPAYKTLAGTEVEAAVLPTEGRTFAPGHALARLDDSETRGIATASSRVWAIRRADLHEFEQWCTELTKSIKATPKSRGLPYLGFLAEADRITSLSERPLAILFDEAICGARLSIATGGALAVEGDLRLPFFEVQSLASGELKCTLEYDTKRTGMPVSYLPTRLPCWKADSPDEVSIRIERPDGSYASGSLEQLFDEFPPRLIMPRGGVVIQRDHWKPSFIASDLPGGVWQPKTWKDCDIQCEEKAPKYGKLNIQDWLQKELDASTGSDTIIVKDHGKGELADFIVIEPHLSKPQIALYHCKGAKGAKASDRIEDVEQVLSQSARSAQWLFRREFVALLLEQTDPGGRNSPIVKADRAALIQFGKVFEVNACTFKVVTVQPGIDCKKAKGSAKIAYLITTTWETISQANGSFEVWGS